METLSSLVPLLAATAEDVWTQKFFGLDQGQRFVLLIIALGCATGIILGLAGIIYSAVNSIHRRRLEIGLKQDLVDRGMSAEEIARVVESAPPRDFLDRWAAGEAKGQKS